MVGKNMNAEKAAGIIGEHEDSGDLDAIMFGLCEPTDATEITKCGHISESVRGMIKKGYTEFEIGFALGVAFGAILNQSSAIVVVDSGKDESASMILPSSIVLH